MLILYTLMGTLSVLCVNIEQQEIMKFTIETWPPMSNLKGPSNLSRKDDYLKKPTPFIASFVMGILYGFLISQAMVYLKV